MPQCSFQLSNHTLFERILGKSADCGRKRAAQDITAEIEGGKLGLKRGDFELRELVED